MIFATVVPLILGTRFTNTWLTTAHEVPVVRVMTVGNDTARVRWGIGAMFSFELSVLARVTG